MQNTEAKNGDGDYMSDANQNNDNDDILTDAPKSMQLYRTERGSMRC